jgi:hypothetical protein
VTGRCHYGYSISYYQVYVKSLPESLVFEDLIQVTVHLGQLKLKTRKDYGVGNHMSGTLYALKNLGTTGNQVYRGAESAACSSSFCDL